MLIDNLTSYCNQWSRLLLTRLVKWHISWPLSPAITASMDTVLLRWIMYCMSDEYQACHFMKRKVYAVEQKLFP